MKEDAQHHHNHGKDSGKEGHEHLHGVVDPSLFSTERGIHAVQLSFWVLFATAVLQAIVVLLSGSVALLADTIHNFADAATAIPLWIAFRFSRKVPTKRFTYGYGRVEDLAGLTIVIVIFVSAVFIFLESLNRYFHPIVPKHLGIVAGCAVVGFIGNELVAIYRIRTGKAIGSAALIADGQHARADGLSSIAVLVSVLGVWLGYPLADPIVGFAVSLFILRIVWQSAKAVFGRLLDGVDPEVVSEIQEAAGHVDGIQDVTEVRVRWIGHRLHAELNVAADSKLSLEDAHELAISVQHELLHHLTYLSNATIHVDPATASGEEHHRIESHVHDGLPDHSH